MNKRCHSVGHRNAISVSVVNRADAAELSVEKASVDVRLAKFY